MNNKRLWRREERIILGRADIRVSRINSYNLKYGTCTVLYIIQYESKLYGLFYFKFSVRETPKAFFLTKGFNTNLYIYYGRTAVG